MKLPPLVAHVVVLIGAAVVSALASAADARPAAPDPERARELVHIVRQDCGSCHGLTLKGGLGPALTAEALADKPAEGLASRTVCRRKDRLVLMKGCGAARALRAAR